MGNDGKDLRAIKAAAKKKLRARIARNITIDPATGCHLWNLQVNNQGYPRMNVWLVDEEGVARHVKLAVHRVVLTIEHRPPKEGEEGAHKPQLCPHRACVNKNHLKWASREENEADKRHPRRIQLPERAIQSPRARERLLEAA